MKFRLIHRKAGWIIQRQQLVDSGFPPLPKETWQAIRTHRFRLLALIHLVWLRERGKTKKISP